MKNKILITQRKNFRLVHRVFLYTFLCLISLSSFALSRYECNEENFIKSTISQTKGINKAESFSNRYDFSTIWNDSNQEYLGYLGKDYYRLYITFTSIEKDMKKPKTYKVQGYTVFKKHKEAFVGEINIEQVMSNNHIDYGVDDEKKGDIVDQGILIAHYQFNEGTHKDAAYFQGTLVSAWYVNSAGQILPSDFSPMDVNNQFLGTWNNPKRDFSKISAWGYYRIPCSNELDMGAGDFSVRPNYRSKGWQ